MTNYFENLDSILTVYRMNYLTAYTRGDYVSASQLLFDRNSAQPPEAFLRDMPRFVLRSNSLRAKIDMNKKAKNYCDHWNYLLEMKMADFRKQNQDKYNRV